MAINKKLIYCETKAQFDTKLAAGEFVNSSVVFIKSTGEFWTHGVLFGGYFSSADTNKVRITLNNKSYDVALNGHKQAYTTLTGSTTVANQAIVSTGTANAWTLKTLGSHAFDSTAYLPLTGGTLTGALTISGTSGIILPYNGSSWLSMVTRTNIIRGSVQQTDSSAHSLFMVKNNAGDAIAFGGLGADIGFYGFDHDRIANNTNSYKWRTVWNAAGNISHGASITAANFIKTGSSDSYVLLGGGGHVAWAAANTANTIVKRTSEGHIQANYYYSVIADENPTIGSVYVRNTSDNYIRRMSFANFKTQLGTLPPEITKTVDWNTIFVDTKWGFFTGATNGPIGTSSVMGISVPLLSSSNYGMQLSGRANNLYFRTKEAGTIQNWLTVLHSSNYSTYTVTKTGGGASGTWAINITGTAELAKAANLVNGTYTGNGGKQPPSYVPSGKVRFNMMNTSANGDTNYKDFILMDTYTGSDVPYVTAIGVAKAATPHAFIMSGKKGETDATKWATAELLSTINYNSYVPTKTGTGASGTWGISITGNAATASSAAKWTTARILTIAGDSTGSVSMDGSANVTCSVTNKFIKGYRTQNTAVSSSRNSTTYDGGTGFSNYFFGTARSTSIGYIGITRSESGMLGLSAYHNILAFGNSDTHAMIGVNYGSGMVIVGGGNADKLTWYKTLAFTDSSITGNAASATKLQNTRTIWGQSFNGTANVSGALSGATTVTASSYFKSTLGTGTAPIQVSSTTVCTNLNADMLDGFQETKFFRYRGATGTNAENTLWTLNGTKAYSNCYPDGMTMKDYAYGVVATFASDGAASAFEIWANHQSSLATATNNGLQYRSGYGAGKMPWRKILDNVNWKQFITYSDLPGAPAMNYLPLTGGTLTGTLTLANGNLVVNRANENPTIGSVYITNTSDNYVRKISWDNFMTNVLNDVGNNASYIRAEYTNSYYGMLTPTMGQSYIRTTSSGLLPYQSGGYGSGHCNIGTSSWYFNEAYIDDVYSTGFHKINYSDNYVLLAGGGALTQTTSATANTIVKRDSGGDVFARRFYTTTTDENSMTISSVYVRSSQDSAIRCIDWTVFKNKVAEGITITNITGNAGTADKWKTGRVLTLSNHASGSVTIDGSKNVTLSVSNNWADASSVTNYLKYTSAFTSGGNDRVFYYSSSNYPSNTVSYNGWASPASGAWQTLHIDSETSGYFTELLFPKDANTGIRYRRRRSSTYDGWYTLLDSSNYADFITAGDSQYLDVVDGSVGSYFFDGLPAGKFGVRDDGGGRYGIAAKGSGGYWEFEVNEADGSGSNAYVHLRDLGGNLTQSMELYHSMNANSKSYDWACNNLSVNRIAISNNHGLSSVSVNNSNGIAMTATGSPCGIQVRSASSASGNSSVYTTASYYVGCGAYGVGGDVGAYSVGVKGINNGYGAGVVGLSQGSGQGPTSAFGDGCGVLGANVDSGIADGRIGVKGFSSGGIGVVGSTTQNVGIYGYTNAYGATTTYHKSDADLNVGIAVYGEARRGSGSCAIKGWGYYGLVGHCSSSAGFAIYGASYQNNSAYWAIYGRGRNGGTTGWTNDSDIRLKYDIHELASNQTKLEQVAKIPLKEFKFISDGSQSYGAIAQEVATYFPEIVFKAPGQEYYSMEYTPLLVLKIAYLEDKCKKLEARIEQLESTINTSGTIYDLESRLTDIENRLGPKRS